MAILSMAEVQTMIDNAPPVRDGRGRKAGVLQAYEEAVEYLTDNPIETEVVATFGSPSRKSTLEKGIAGHVERQEVLQVPGTLMVVPAAEPGKWTYALRVTR